jgi:hypothetical protein
MTADGRGRGSVVLAAVCWGFACAPEAPPEPVSSLLDAVVPVEGGAPSDAPSLPWLVGGEPTFRVGGTDDRNTHQFVEATAAGARSDGSVVVADARTGLVRLYAPTGRLITSLGAPGDGPGELRSPTDVRVGPGDSIVVWDATAWRATVFGPDGAFVRTERYDPTEPGLYPHSGMWPSEVRLGPPGSRVVRLVGKGMTKGASAKGEPVGGEGVGFAFHGAGASDLHLIGYLPEEERVDVDAPWGVAEVVPPLASGPRVAVGPEGRVCVGHTRWPEILCSAPDGVPRGVRWEEEWRAVGSGDRDVERWRSATLEAYGQKMSGAEARALVDRVPVPETGPAFRRLHLDAHDHLWIELGPSGDRGDTGSYLVLDAELTVVGRLELPALDLLEIGDDYVLAVRTDAFDIPEVVVFTLSR